MAFVVFEGRLYGDTEAINRSQNCGARAQHLGFGDFRLDFPNGWPNKDTRVEFRRTGRDVPGFTPVGRIHEVRGQVSEFLWELELVYLEELRLMYMEQRVGVYEEDDPAIKAVEDKLADVQQAVSILALWWTATH